VIQLFPLRWLQPTSGIDSSAEVPEPRFRSITIMLTELCNLNCWMCDFAVSKGLKEAISWSADEYLEFLSHPFFKDLNSIGFTGGEPFVYAGLKPLYSRLQERFPSMFISFSSNALLFKPMSETFALTRDWKNTRLFTSIDGVQLHDVQRGRQGAFETSMGNLARLRELYPALGIDIKFTITPVNHAELKDAYVYCTERGFNFTAKLIENNPYYTSVNSSASRDQEFTLSPAQLQTVREQLDWILGQPQGQVSQSRRRELEELALALDPEWRRDGRCAAPTEAAFLDARLNFFTCKEYPPVLNLNDRSLDQITESMPYRQAIEFERCNGGVCTRCTSQLKTSRTHHKWARLFG
jgi:MoaA/NifB/PqqE/SkfB family radical SAM enzyme